MPLPNPTGRFPVTAPAGTINEWFVCWTFAPIREVLISKKNLMGFTIKSKEKRVQCLNGIDYTVSSPYKLIRCGASVWVVLDDRVMLNGLDNDPRTCKEIRSR